MIEYLMAVWKPVLKPDRQTRQAPIHLLHLAHIQFDNFLTQAAEFFSGVGKASGKYQMIVYPEGVGRICFCRV
jgi:hypothetical protein